ncbi:arylamine N-acetyltransferase [Ammoniphilus sp. YIM 78166]|uniref:arylamine N-acetyltransferase family protein n=1 Tax=Ammoniphilus sp. YIM 78166 TaxID=1644106 RepID=UPI0010706899|nr:arylamine N-acetyltransferase [Ammoniphilus sp. YIM 78166]
MKVVEYLHHIQAEERASRDLDYVSYLQRCHVLRIYFENWDILNRIPLSLKEEDLIEKLVHRRRGGVCYELNGLFYLLLKELGYDVVLTLGTVLQRDGNWALEDGHMFIIVVWEHEEYLVDVGFGGHSPRLAVPLDGREVRDTDGDYRVIREGNMLYLQKKTEAEWFILYRFEKGRKAWTLTDIEPICVLTETSPQSIFNRMIFFSRVYENGRVTLLGDTLIEVENDHMEKRKLVGEEIKEAAKRYFQICI